MKVKSRIQPAPACDIIKLDKSELEVYTGAGWKIAGFKAGHLAKLIDLDEYEWIEDEPFDETVERATNHNVEVLQSLENEGLECWLVMASCTELCDPTPIASSDALSVAKIARRIGESLAEM